MASDLFSIGSSGLRAHQAAMGVISENIANASTEGYTRRSLQIKKSAISSTSMIIYRSTAQYGGVEIGGVMRGNDDFLDQAARQSIMFRGRADARAEWLASTQSALNDSSLGVGSTLTSLFSASEKLAANPSEPTLRMNLLFAFEQVNTAFAQTSSDLKMVRSGIGTEANSEVTTFNIALEQLADANLGLRRVGEGTAAAAHLLDQRDQALSEITKRLDATVTFGENGAAQVTYDGQDLVLNGTFSKLSVAQDATDGTLSFAVNGTAVTNPANGALGGLTQSAQIVRDRIDSLNTLAAQYVSDVNSWHSGGETAAGAAGGPMLSIGADAGTIQTLITNGADIAAGTPGGAANGNLVAITNIRGSGSVEEGWTGLISGHANLVSAAKQEQTAATNRDLLAQAARSDVSGVNLDREAAELIRLQQAYQASARIIQVARELTETIFSIF